MIRRLLSYVKEYKKESILTPLSMVIEVAMEMVVPLLMASLVDEGIKALTKETFEKEFESLKDNNLDMADKVAILASRFKVTEEMAKRRIEELELWDNGN